MASKIDLDFFDPSGLRELIDKLAQKNIGVREMTELVSQKSKSNIDERTVRRWLTGVTGPRNYRETIEAVFDETFWNRFGEDYRFEFRIIKMRELMEAVDNCSSSLILDNEKRVLRLLALSSKAPNPGGVMSMDDIIYEGRIKGYREDKIRDAVELLGKPKCIQPLAEEKVFFQLVENSEDGVSLLFPGCQIFLADYKERVKKNEEKLINSMNAKT